MFTPLGTTDGPLGSSLAVTRITFAEYMPERGSRPCNEVITDLWVHSDSRRALQKKWTGTTVFQIRDQLYSGFELLAHDFQPYVDKVNKTRVLEKRSRRQERYSCKESWAPGAREREQTICDDKRQFAQVDDKRQPRNVEVELAEQLVEKCCSLSCK